MTLFVRFGVVVLLSLVPRLASAQYADAATPGEVGPAGNAHPDSEVVAHAGAALENPFGEPHTIVSDDIAARAAFADAVDLTPLHGLAVFHNGRVKILDTLGRETVEFLTGRHELKLPVPEAQREAVGGVAVSFDPVFTLLDLAIDPAFSTPGTTSPSGPSRATCAAAAMDLGATRGARATRSEVNAAIAPARRGVPTINAELYPTIPPPLELAYNRTNAFEWGYWAYLSACWPSCSRSARGASGSS
jgi:hypothetical protein